MNQDPDSDAVSADTAPDTIPRNNRASSDSPPVRQLPSTEDERPAFDRERFPDGFYPGLIVFLDRVRGRGVVRSYSGREIRFEFPFVTVVGGPLGGRLAGIELLNQGDTVGFDVGWTSRGLRVTTIKPAAKV
jgi:hypothetical protein